MKKLNVAIVGGGPAGLFAAYKLSSNPDIEITIFEKGNSEDNRSCPSMEKGIPCAKCKTCSIMTGLGGCGSFSDGKFPITNEFGGNLWEKIGKEKALELMYEVDNINHALYLTSKGWEEGLIQNALSVGENQFIDDDFPKLFSSKGSVYKRICTQHNLHLLDADIRHLGTDIGQVIYKELIRKIREAGIQVYTNAEIVDIQISGNQYKLSTETDTFKFDKVVIAAGRSGSSWTKKICKTLNIPTKSNRVDLGVRFECPNEIWDHITKDLYESKITYRTKTYEDVVRTFCMNPAGAVVTENTNGGITVNGHSFEDPKLKTANTNFALLVSKTFTEPFDDSSEYGEAIVKLSNMLGGGVIVQRYGDLIRGKRSTKSRIRENTVRPTLNAEPGDLSLVLPKRILDDVLEMIEALDHLVPGMKNDDNLLYGIELKKYDEIVDVNNSLEAKEGLYIIGDGSGWTHSLSQSSASGLFVAGDILSKWTL